MSDHLPECPPWVVITGNEADCICDRLRAAEQRMRSAELAEAKALLASRDEAWLAGLAAAREAVAALPKGGMGLRAHELWRMALAAIDALEDTHITTVYP